MRCSSFGILLVCIALAGIVHADVIVLRDGQTIRAEVLRADGARVIVDLGFEVLTIPRDFVQSIEKESTLSEGKPQIEQDTGGLFSTATMPVSSVKALAERFGEAVVLVSSPSGLGSGFFISRDGHLITNFHVIEKETRIAVTVFLKSGNEFARTKYEDVDIIATNPFLDLALLRVGSAELAKGSPPTITYLATDDELSDGETTFAIGNPLGFERSISHGIVSNRSRAFEGLVYIQTTTQINPGNSGGPLFDTRGQVVGVTNMKIMGGEGLGFAIPVRYVIDFLKNRKAFAYNSESSSAGYRYVQPPPRAKAESPDLSKRE